MEMYSWQNMRDIWKAEKFDLIKFKSQFHEDFMFIRETSLVDRDEFCAEIDQLMAEGKNNIPFDDMELIHENDDVTELRWVIFSLYLSDPSAEAHLSDASYIYAVYG